MHRGMKWEFQKGRDESRTTKLYNCITSWHFTAGLQLTVRFQLQRQCIDTDN